MRPALLDRTRSCGQKPRRVLACERDAPIEGSGYRVVASHSRLKPFGSGDADWVSGQVRAAPCAFRPPAGSEGRCQSQIMTNPRSTQRISEIASSAPSKCHEVSENEACEVLVSFFCPISSSCGDLIGPNRSAKKIAGKRSPMMCQDGFGRPSVRHCGSARKSHERPCVDAPDAAEGNDRPSPVFGPPPRALTARVSDPRGGNLATAPTRGQPFIFGHHVRRDLHRRGPRRAPARTR